jgi:hypothetical protein
MNYLYIVDLANFSGSILNTMPFVDVNTRNGAELLQHTYVHYKDGVTFAEYNKQNGGNLSALTWDVFGPMLEDYNRREYCKPFSEISEAQYYDWLECLPPCKWHDLNGRFNSFYISEALTADLHQFCIKDRKTGKYYAATRSRFIKDAELLAELNQLETLTA